MKKQKIKPPVDPIPKWFVTYSDVITLLMTFFILLMTFASNEPEGFAVMQDSMFGAGGSAGNVGVKVTGIERDTIVVRTKPPSSRLTSRGSEIPPMYTDPVTKAADRGLQALDERNDMAQFEQFSLLVSIHLYLDAKGRPTEVAIRHLKMLASQMKRIPLDLTFTVPDEKYVAGVTTFAELLTRQFEVPPGRVAISLGSQQQIPPGRMRLTLQHEI